jgi:hypothetical protein
MEKCMLNLIRKKRIDDRNNEKLAQHIVRAHFVDSLYVAQYLAKLQHKIELSPGP